MPIEPIQDRVGIVYALTNVSLEGLVKIGRTARSLPIRMSELYGTGLPDPFDVGFAVRVPDCVRVENALHLAFDPYRHRREREFFRIKVFQIRAIMALLGDEVGVEDVTDVVAENPSLIPGETIRRRASGTRGPTANFTEMGLLPGTPIVCPRYEKEAMIAGERTIIFEGEEMYLTTATGRIAPTSNDAFRCWEYNGETLQRIYDRTYQGR